MPKLIVTCLRICAALLLGLGPVAQPLAQNLPRGFTYEVAPESQPMALAILLPGSGVLGVFDDRAHVLAEAVKLRTYGLDTLIVDTQMAIGSGMRGASGTAGDRAAAAATDAVRWAKSNLSRAREAPIVLVSWSFGGEAVIRLLGDPTLLTELQIRGAVMYYPSNQNNLNTPLKRPAIAFFGDADDVTPAARFNAFTLPFGEGTIPLEIVTIAGARHGFDVRGGGVQRVIRSFPFFGSAAPAQPATDAATLADQRTQIFLRNLVGGR